MSFRIFCTLFLLLSVCAFPLYFTIAVGLFSVIWFKKYFEILPLCFLHDMLYGVPLERFYHFQLVLTLGACVFVVAKMLIEKQLFDESPLGARLK